MFSTTSPSPELQPWKHGQGSGMEGRTHPSPETPRRNEGVSKKQVGPLAWSAPTAIYVVLELVIQFKKWNIKEEKVEWHVRGSIYSSEYFNLQG